MYLTATDIFHLLGLLPQLPERVLEPVLCPCWFRESWRALNFCYACYHFRHVLLMISTCMHTMRDYFERDLHRESRTTALAV